MLEIRTLRYKNNKIQKNFFIFISSNVVINKLNKLMMHHYRFLGRLFDFSNTDIQLISFFSALTAFLVSFCNNFLGISLGLFFMLFTIMIVDYITGLTAAKLEEKRKAREQGRQEVDIFSSRKGLGWVFKFGAYMTFLYVSVLLQDYIAKAGFDPIIWFIKLIHFYILMHIFYWEIKSVDENFERLGYNFRILKLVGNLIQGVSRLPNSGIKEDKKETDEYI